MGTAECMAVIYAWGAIPSTELGNGGGAIFSVVICWDKKNGFRISDLIIPEPNQQVSV